MNQFEYEVINESSVFIFWQRVNAMLKEGWILHGSMQVVHFPTYTHPATLFQAFTRPIKDEEKKNDPA